MAEARHSSAYPLEVAGATITVDSPLHGEHQHRNIALAIAAAVELATQHGLPVTVASIEQGIRTTDWPGRLERIEAGASDWVLDVAHNPAGAWALRAALRSEFGLGEPGGARAMLLFGCLRDKPLAEMAQILFPLFDEVIFAPIASPRATPMADLLDAAGAVGVRARAAESVEEALVLAESATAISDKATGNRAAGGQARLRVVAGSVYLVGEVRPLLLARRGLNA